jgi:hypothetical protein
MKTLTDAVVTALAAAPFEVGDGKPPPDDPPYATVYSLGTGLFDGDQQDDQSLYAWDCQVTSVGVSREQAEAAADIIRGILHAGITVSGLTVMKFKTAGALPTSREEDGDVIRYSVMEDFRALIAPA